MIKLHGFAMSNYFNMVKHGLMIKDCEFTENTVYSQTLEILAVTNTGKVPAMTTATGVHLTETTVILGYLEKPIQHRRYSLLQQRKETKHID
jgi:glutathione S-transferase